MYDSVRHKDSKTGVFGDLLIHIETLKSSIRDDIKICRRLSKVEIEMRTKHDDHLETLNLKLQDEKLNFDRLSQERKKSELYKIQKLEEEIRKLKREKDESEMNQLDHSLELISNTIHEIDEQYTQVKDKHRKSVLSSMFHKIAKTFMKKSKGIDLPPEQDDLEIDIKHFMY
ncbi:PHLOEM PROTEIN 2-LIKE A3 [Biomphalaria pfeifferi]|uniref:PHLOEM PROTEIN 2-LIKE A3 n=1 Tax=Biomphalaria pfeifferi TaxID=112525 RepID=A0AAD8B2D0_BIOPF|nr:PHLOEM PROTEIN 2-LIKE A3 [Biomphalaria pfeifferi]